MSDEDDFGQIEKVIRPPRSAERMSLAAARVAIADFIDGNAHRVQDWLDRIEEKEGPRAAFDSYVKLLEFVIPKPQRVTVAAEDGKDAMPTINISFTPPIRTIDGEPLAESGHSIPPEGSGPV